MILCITHSPKRVVIVKRTISRRTLPEDVLNVYFLFAKKLKQNEIVVERMFAETTGRPIALNTNSKPKSRSVLAPPTTRKRNFSCLFFMLTTVIFLNEV